MQKGNAKAIVVFMAVVAVAAMGYCRCLLEELPRSIAFPLALALPICFCQRFSTWGSYLLNDCSAVLGPTLSVVSVH